MESTEELLEKDEDLKATESRIVELRQKKDKTAEEEAEFKELRKHHKGRIEEQIQNEREIARKERERADQAAQDLADARARLKDIEEKRDARVEPTNGGSESETYEINGKKFYTDDAISLRVQKGLMSQKEGWAMQRAAIKEEAKAEMAGDEPKKKWEKERADALEYVKSKGYGWVLEAEKPGYVPKNSSETKESPFYKIANKLWKNGYQYDSDGPRKALEDAIEFSGKNVQREDLSQEFGIPKNNAAASSQRQKTIELDKTEQDNAYRWYVVGNIINPKTGKHYTETEALAKALEAKRKRLVK